MAERERIRPTAEGRARLLAAVEVGAPTCLIDPGALGEYAAVLVASGQAAADAAFPETASHLQAGCATCPDDLRDLLVLLRATDDDPAPAASPSTTHDSGIQPADVRLALLGEEDVSGVTRRPIAPERPASSAVPPDVPRPSAPALPAARRRLTVRDWLLIGAAAAVVLVGLGLIGMAYMTARGGGSGQRIPTVVPVFRPAPPVSSPGGRPAPSGMNCPQSHPIKGNRESMVYHAPGDEFYDRTRPEECFAAPADAEAAGFRASRR